MIEIFVLCSMLFLHIVADFNLQGMLGNLKCADWWKENYPDEMYKNDYITALFLHAFSWTFMTLLPLAVYGLLTGHLEHPYADFWWIALILNFVAHLTIDDAKANLRCLNLTQDQVLHFIQIVITWLFWLNFE